MNIVLFGSTDLTFSIANFLRDNSYDIAAIVTTPEVFSISYKADGVNNVRFADMYTWAQAYNIPTIVYETAQQTIDELTQLSISLDLGLVAGWYHMVPSRLRALFKKGCSGFHSSLLPKLRGGAPLNWAILNDLTETGVSFFELSDGVDDGLLFAQQGFAIDAEDDIGDLVRKSEQAILYMLEQTLPKIKTDEMIKYAQEGTPSYCGQRNPSDSLIDWTRSADSILRLIRASSHPYAGAYTYLDDERITLWKAQPCQIEAYGAPGQIMVINGQAYIICDDGAICISDADNLSLILRSNQKRLASSVNIQD